MPNWCSTGVTFYSENKEQIVAMQKRFHEIFESEPTEENGFGKGWMGDFANTFFPELGAKKIDCRGRAEEYDADGVRKKKDYYYFRILTETAWGSKIGLWYKIAKRFYPAVRIAYCGEESGCGYYVKWDASGGELFYPETWCVEYCLPDKNGELVYAEDEKYSFHSLAQIQKHLDKILPFSYTHIDDVDRQMGELQEKLDKYTLKHMDVEDDLYIMIEKFDRVHPSEFQFLM